METEKWCKLCRGINCVEIEGRRIMKHPVEQCPDFPMIASIPDGLEGCKTRRKLIEFKINNES